MLASLGDVVRDARLQVPLRLVEDLTEQVTGLADPVWKVRVDGRYAILRTVINTDSLSAYEAFTGSRITADLLAYGSTNDQSWAVIEWVPGVALLDVSAIPIRMELRLSGHIDDALDLSEVVLSTAARLPRIPSPASAIDHCRARMERRARLLAGQPGGDTAAALANLLDSYWGDPVQQLGDLTPMNVVTGAAGDYRFIDLAGGQAPMDGDAGWWTATVIYVTVGKAGMDRIDHALTFTDRLADGLPHLDLARLRYWTASAYLDGVLVAGGSMFGPVVEALEVAAALVDSL